MVKTGHEGLERPPVSVGPRPHVVAGVRGDEEFVAVRPESVVHQVSEVLLGRSVIGAVVVGQVEVDVQLKSRKGSSRSKSLRFTVEASEHNGFITEAGRWTLNFDTGKKIRGIGENINRDPRPGKNPKYTYDYLLPKLSANGVNFIRTWLQSSTYPNEWRWNEGSEAYERRKDQRAQHQKERLAASDFCQSPFIITSPQ